MRSSRLFVSLLLAAPVCGFAQWFANYLIALSDSLSKDKAKAITAALREIGEPIKQLLNADGFDSPDPSHFEQLRTLVAVAAESAPKTDGASA